jgi:hypothetical protein
LCEPRDREWRAAIETDHAVFRIRERHGNRPNLKIPAKPPTDSDMMSPGIPI